MPYTALNNRFNIKCSYLKIGYSSNDGSGWNSTFYKSIRKINIETIG